MSNKSYVRSDKELDDILREISDSAEIPFSEEDWGDMKARLDKTSAPSPGWWGKRNLGWSGAVLLILLISIVFWNPLQEKKDLNQNTTAYETQNNIPESNEGRSKSTEITHSEATLTQDEAKPVQSSTAKASGLGKPGVSEPKIQVIENGKVDKTASEAILSEIPEFKKLENTTFLWQTNQIPAMDYEDFRPEDGLILAKTAADGGLVKKERKPHRFAGRFNISVQAAPDLSGIKLNQVGKAGQAVGIGAEYFLRPRISVSSGVFYSFKPYSTEGGYQSGYGDQPDRVIGECDILDIPLNLRFYPLEGKLQRVFASVGLSSYLMLKEHYELEYKDTGTGYPYTHEIDVKGANNHFFGVANFSIGYERKLAKQLSIQVEPYFKVPLNGVGEGDISLKSTGLFVGLKFYPGRPDGK
ncbi:hypothetical protein [Algoriphagus resistens]|uniref:hypothetical protein n=1 Tax=Algoriphagus resistens TaxID=1750590 RepID=UPI000716BFD9|nr:hypothetical protein [Algoriphagus resistens]